MTIERGGYIPQSEGNKNRAPKRSAVFQSSKTQPEIRELVTTLQFDTSELVSEINRIVKEIKITEDLHREVRMLRRRVEALERKLS